MPAPHIALLPTPPRNWPVPSSGSFAGERGPLGWGWAAGRGRCGSSRSGCGSGGWITAACWRRRSSWSCCAGRTTDPPSACRGPQASSIALGSGVRCDDTSHVAVGLFPSSDWVKLCGPFFGPHRVVHFGRVEVVWSICFSSFPGLSWCSFCPRNLCLFFLHFQCFEYFLRCFHYN